MSDIYSLHCVFLVFLDSYNKYFVGKRKLQWKYIFGLEKIHICTQDPRELEERMGRVLVEARVWLGEGLAWASGFLPTLWALQVFSKGLLIGSFSTEFAHGSGVDWAQLGSDHLGCLRQWQSDGYRLGKSPGLVYSLSGTWVEAGTAGLLGHLFSFSFASSFFSSSSSSSFSVSSFVLLLPFLPLHHPPSLPV